MTDSRTSSYITVPGITASAVGSNCEVVAMSMVYTKLTSSSGSVFRTYNEISSYSSTKAATTRLTSEFIMHIVIVVMYVNGSRLEERMSQYVSDSRRQRPAG